MGLGSYRLAAQLEQKLSGLGFNRKDGYAPEWLYKIMDKLWFRLTLEEQRILHQEWVDRWKERQETE